jgi:1-acyl-sn-glycerol-3-phosphate acyltransferase
MPERNNPDHPLIFASNHSGMAFPWDAMVFASEIFRRNNFEFHHVARALTAPMLSQSRLMNPFLIENFWKRCGGIDATSLNFETMMYYKKSNVLVYPEGVPGIGKGFNKRYQLQRFSTSFIRISLKYRTDIIPFATVNGEYINPYNLKSEFLNKIVQKIGIPFLPVGFMTLLIPFQPWIFYFAFPAKLTYVMGKRIKPYELVDKPIEQVTEKDISHVTHLVKKQMQEELNEAVRQYGQKPYEAKELFSIWKKNYKKFPFFTASFWPSLFAEMNRSYRVRGTKTIKVGFWSGVKALYFNPMTIAFFLPIIGWIPILIHGLRGRKKA